MSPMDTKRGTKSKTETKLIRSIRSTTMTRVAEVAPKQASRLVAV